MSGSVQLPKKGVESLLKFRPAHWPPASNTNMARPVKEPENVDDPPQDTTSEDEPHDEPDDDPDDEPDEARYADIQRTVFKKRGDPATATAVTDRPRDDKGKGSARGAGKTSSKPSTRASKRARTEEVDSDNDSSFHVKKKPKSGSASIAAEVGHHMSLEAQLQKNSDRRRPVAKYSKKGRKPHDSTPRNNRQRSPFPSDSVSPVQKRLRDRFGSIHSSPVRLELSQTKEAEDGSSSDLSDPPSSVSDKSDPPRALRERNQKKKRPQRQAKKGKNNFSELSAEPMSQLPQFKMPDAYRDYAPGELVDLRTAMDDVPMVEKRQLGLGMTLCPMCDEQVDEELLKEFSKGGRLRLAQQAKFCLLHKKKSAETAYKENKYPKVNWTSLEKRVERHHDYLQSLIMGAESHFGSILTENIRMGHARTLLTTKEYPTPGYYGLRGMNVMAEIVTEMFSKVLRKRAPTDTRISGRGYMGFVLSVLVPELAVKLIQEDMALNEDEARDIMIASRTVGEILHDEKRHSQSQAQVETEMEEERDNEGKAGHEEDEKCDDENRVMTNIRPTNLGLQEMAETDSDLSTPPALSERQASINGEQSRPFDDSDSDGNLAPRGVMSKKAMESVKKQDVTTLPTRSTLNRSRSTNKDAVRVEIADSDNDNSDSSDISDLSSVLESI